MTLSTTSEDSSEDFLTTALYNSLFYWNFKINYTTAYRLTVEEEIYLNKRQLKNKMFLTSKRKESFLRKTGETWLNSNSLNELALLLIKGGGIERIPHNLKKYRIKRKMTQAELAERLKIDRTAITHYESGSRLPNTAVFIDLAEILDVNLDDLTR
ncbi:helix-turn-helix transcriptional regulator [Lacticaseibacillus casei]|uniref:helix-turn-helix domain-containing protein n=1 Tax=Lacticaseibacillus casei TaxID=1582 RepID=UPI001C38A107|nr:helix-turn-helix transcriptional regulator [Lacticaseibacillus casei]MDG3061354.1 helix-turn-helix transcriptional regulator [Lacticaseibacillus sp. BCRC 81376]QXG60352.1 helix-turn-helix transcriptional regulator [Lacticaseibacillus casei]